MLDNQFLDTLRATGRKRIPYKDVITGFVSVFPEFQNESNLHERIVALLYSLQENRKVSLPKNKKLWDKRTRPDTPRWVQLKKEHDDADKGGDQEEGPPVHWVPELSFASRAVNPTQIKRLKELNRFIIEARKGAIDAPIKERSLEIFDDEKVLDKILSNGSFYKGQLSLEQLKCYIAPEPIAYELCSANLKSLIGLPILVVENVATYYSFAKYCFDKNLFAAIAYSSGNELSSFMPSLQILKNKISSKTVYYFGDIDPAGFKIFEAAMGLRLIDDFKLCLPLYKVLFKIGHKSRNTKKMPPDIRSCIKSLLPPPMASNFIELFNNKQRIAQEALGSKWLSKNITCLQNDIGHKS